MEMASLNITRPEPLKVLIEIEAEERGYASVSDYICALIQEAEQRKSAEAVESLLLEGLDPNNRAAMSDAEWEAHKQKHRNERLTALREEIAAGLDDVAQGRVYSAEEVLRRLEARNKQAMKQRTTE